MIISAVTTTTAVRVTGEQMTRRKLLPGAGALLAALAAVTGCTSSDEGVQTPGLDPRGTVLTTVKPVKQDLTNKISLSGKVTINPIFGIVAPSDGELRFVQREWSATVSTARPTWVATVWNDGRPKRVELPADTIFAGRLMEDRADVVAGMPIVSAAHAGYGIVAEIDSALAYRINSAAKDVTAQIKNGPGPFDCEPLGTIAALPAGTVPEPEPEPAKPAPGASGAPVAPQPGPEPEAPAGPAGSEATGLRLVCTPPDDVKLINGAAATLELITGKAEDVLVLPVEAIAGSQGKGKVDVLDENRNRTTVDVELGLTDGKVVEIKKGLTGDETVAIPGPNLPAAPPAPADAGQPSGVGG